MHGMLLGNLYILFIIVILLTGKYTAVYTFITQYSGEELWNENQDEYENKNYDKVSIEAVYSSPTNLSPAPTKKTDRVAELGNPKSYLNLKTMYSSNNVSSKGDSKSDAETRKGSGSFLTNTHKDVNDTNDNGTGLLRHKMYRYEGLNNTNDYKTNPRERFTAGNHDIKGSNTDVLRKTDNLNFNVNKILSEPNLERIFVPTLNAVISKLLFSLPNQDESYKNQESKKSLSSDRKLDNTKVGTFEGNDSIEKLEEYLSSQLMKSLESKKNSIKSNEGISLETLINRLVLEKEFVDNMALKHNYAEAGHLKNFNADNSNSRACNCSENRSCLNEINYYKRLQDIVDSVLKEIILKDIENNSDNNVIKTLQKLVPFNPRSYGEHEKIKKFYVATNKETELNSNKMMATPRYGKDKYYLHNIVKMSNDQQDKEFPIGTPDQLKNILYNI